MSLRATSTTLLRALAATAAAALAAVAVAFGGCSFELADVEEVADSGHGADGGGLDAGTEGCLDRVDNNGDGLADCEDPACAADFVCAPVAVEEALGVGWVYLGSEPPACELGEARELYDPAELTAGPSGCACACSEPSGGRCTALLRCSPNSCQGAAVGGALAANDCSPWVPASGSQYCWAEPAHLSVDAGACEPVADSVPPPHSWPRAGRACLRMTGGHCPGLEQQCLPRPPSGAQFPCMAFAGEVDCAAEALVLRLVLGNGTTIDGRGCDGSGCSCGEPTGRSCSCAEPPCGVAVFNSGDCSGTAASVAELADGGPCVPSPPDLEDASVRLNGVAVSGGQCVPAGEATPIGAVDADELVTLCCGTLER
jgi:hypothetical protein